MNLAYKRFKNIDVFDLTKLQILSEYSFYKDLYHYILCKKFNVPNGMLSKKLVVQFNKLSDVHSVQLDGCLYNSIIYVGLGGTGTCFLELNKKRAKVMCKVAYSDYYFYDPDIVEPKNLSRQIFSQNLLMKPKLTSLLGFDFCNQNVRMFQEYFTKEKFYEISSMLRGDVLILGFSDLIQFRKDMVDLLDEIDLNEYKNINSITYIDSGNSVTSGQAIKSVVTKHYKDIPNSIRRLSQQEDVTKLGCAEIEQTFYANIFSALSTTMLLNTNLKEAWFDYKHLKYNYFITDRNIQIYPYCFSDINRGNVLKIDLNSNESNPFIIEYLEKLSNVNKIQDMINFLNVS